MAKPQKNKVSGGRVTPKGTQNPVKGAKKAAEEAKNAGAGATDALGDAMADVDAAKGLKDAPADAVENVTDAAASATDVAGGKVDAKTAAATGAAAAGSAKVAGKKPTKRKVSGGRVTPKGTQNYTKKAPEGASHTHYEDLPPSPTWVPVLMFALLIIGALVIMVNYLGYLPPYNDVPTAFEPDTGIGSGTSNWYLLLGLGFILGGIITATKFR